MRGLFSLQSCFSETILLSPTKGSAAGRPCPLCHLPKSALRSPFHSLQVAQRLKRLPAMRVTWVRSLGREDSPGEGNGNPLQYSCLENPMDRGAWWATVHGIAKSRTRLSNFTFHFHFSFHIQLVFSMCDCVLMGLTVCSWSAVWHLLTGCVYVCLWSPRK